MKRLLLILLFVAIIFAGWWLFFKDKSGTKTAKEEPLKVLNHSSTFNASVTKAMNSYFDMKSAFVNADILKVKEHNRNFLSAIDSIQINELNHDSASIYQSATVFIGDIKANATAILSETDITEMRQDFRMISENLYPLLKTIKYEGPALYWQNCPMAFGEDKEGNWISNTVEINNPYLGLKDPKFKGGMVHCGEVKDTIK